MDPREDVLDQGPRRARRRPVAAVVAATLALGVLAVLRVGDEPEPEPEPTARALTPPVDPAGDGPCGTPERAPSTTTTPLREHTGLRVLVGGAELAVVDLDSGRRGAVTAVTSGLRAHTLLARGGDVYASRSPACRGGETVGYRVDASGRPHRLGTGRVVAGGAGAWLVDEHDADGVVLRDADGPVRLPRGVVPVGVAASTVVATRVPRIVLVDPDTGDVVRRVGTGVVRAVGGDTVVWSGRDCAEDGPRDRCALHVTRLDGGRRDVVHRLPVGRVPVGEGVLSDDGGHVAFELTDRGRRRAEVAVLEVGSSRLSVVPGLRLPPKPSVGLAFSPGARWLVLTAVEGDHGTVLLWRRGARQLSVTKARLPGPLVTGPSVVVTG